MFLAIVMKGYRIVSQREFSSVHGIDFREPGQTWVRWPLHGDLLSRLVLFGGGFSLLFGFSFITLAGVGANALNTHHVLLHQTIFFPNLHGFPPHHFPAVLHHNLGLVPREQAPLMHGVLDGVPFQVLIFRGFQHC